MAIETSKVGAAIRGEFPIFEHTTYANSCSQGALSRRVRAAYEEYLDGWDANGAEWEVWVERADAARSAFARLLHAESSELAVTTSVTQGVSGIVSALDLRTRPRIVISEYEFPTVGQIAHAQELRGAEVVHVTPEPDGSIPPERFAEAIDERTALVCCTTISYRTGHRHDVGEIARLAHDAGALCLADSYQAIGAIDFDARALGVDFVTGGTVKYLLGSSGLGFLYVRRELLPELLPSQTGWFADEDIFQMDISDYSPAADARRFDAGTPPVPNIYGGLAGMSIVEEAGTAGDRGARRRAVGTADRRPRRARRARRHPARAGAPRPARLREVDGRAHAGRRRSTRRGSSARSATRTCASRSTSTTSTRTWTRSSRRSRATVTCWPRSRYTLRRYTLRRSR